MHVMEDFDPDLNAFHCLIWFCFKKFIFTPTLNRAVSKPVPSEDLIVPYSSTDLATAEKRISN